MTDNPSRTHQFHFAACGNHSTGQSKFTFCCALAYAMCAIRMFTRPVDHIVRCLCASLSLVGLSIGSRSRYEPYVAHQNVHSHLRLCRMRRKKNAHTQLTDRLRASSGSPLLRHGPRFTICCFDLNSETLEHSSSEFVPPYICGVSRIILRESLN